MSKADKLKKATEKTEKPSKTTSSEDLTYEEKEVKIVDKEKRTNELTFKKLQLKNQILLRPDTYIGSTKKVKYVDPIWVLEKDKFVQKQVAITEGFVRLFIECVSNAIDNVWRSDEFKIPCKYIKINIDTKEGLFSVWNDGKTIPIEKHKEENIYIPELIFGNLLTSSNYNDSEERKTSGKNGIGCKAVSIFSTHFGVECFNPDKGIYKQTWENNMDKVSKPDIDTVKSHFPKKIEEGKNGYTKVSWKPELSRFDMKEIDNDTMSVIEKYIVDTAMTVCKYGVKVLYNDKEIVMKDYKDYIRYYFKELPDEFMLFNQPENTCVVCPANEFTHISFVNGINTKDGGVHVDAWCEQLFRPLLNKLNEKTKKFDMRDIKKHFFIFVNCSLDKPRFDNQSKTRLNSPQPAVEIKPAAITKLSKWKFLSVMKESLKLKDMLNLKSETERKRGTSRIEGLDDANFAGKSGKSGDCILCIAEGQFVNTGYNSMKIEDFKTYDGKVVSFCDKENSLIKSKVLNFFEKGEKKCVKVTFEDGRTLICTPEHKLLNEKNEWIEAKDSKNINIKFGYTSPSCGVDLDFTWELKIKNVVFNLKTIENYNKTLAFVRLLGYLITDGHIRKFTINNNEYYRSCLYLGHINDVNEVLSDIYLLCGKTPQSLTKKNLYSIELPVELTKLYISLKGVTIGSKVSQDYELPLFILEETCPLSVVREFLGGLFGGDGQTVCIDNTSNILTRIGFSQTKIEEKLDSLKNGFNVLSNLLNRFSIKTTIRKERKRKHTNNFELVLYVCRDSTIKFAEEIGFRYCCHKNQRLTFGYSYFLYRDNLIRQYQNFIDNVKKYKEDNNLTIKHAFECCYNNLPESDIITFGKNNIKIGTIYRQLNRDFSNCNRCPDTYNVLSATEFFQKIGVAHFFLRQSDRKISYGVNRESIGYKTYNLSVVKIEDVGLKKVYDLEIENTHNFLVNGAIVHNCTTEGISAKTYVVKGMKYGLFGKKGHDYIGVLPIRGKFINVRNASINSIIKNKEVKSLIQALGLQHGLDYSLEENRKKLRYGKFVCISDADVDGFHITSLLYNFFDVLFPSLVRNNDFFYFMRIPILKITDKKTPKDFYFLNEAQKYLTENKIKKDNVRYFKGLGTSNDQDIKNDFGKKVVQIESKTKESQELINNIFSKDTADFRKDWLAKFVPDNNKPNVEDKIDIAEFINEELIHFSIDDCKRSIPSLLDGLKESQRKVLYSAIKRNLSFKAKSLKVAQFAGYIAENTNYHHGEQNLYDTITKLAQRFVGSNNIPLLFNDGQFGERIENGKDAANGRYIFTKLDCLTRYIFREEDDDFLEHKNDDGDIIEKKYYIPIVPNILINGNTGIGTGWSCNIPSYNLIDIINWINLWIKEKEAEQKDELVLVDKPELVPYFRNFKGTVKVDGHKVITTGVIKKVGNTYVITEIPIGRKNMSISKYKEKLEELKEKGIVKTIRDNSTENDVNFTITISDDDIEMDNLFELLCLTDTIYTNNMVLFDKNETLQKYNSVQKILKTFCADRYDLYVKRREGILKAMEFDLKILQNKKRFISEITEGKLVIKDKEDDELEEELKKKKYATKDDKYDYLTTIQMRQITKTKIKELQTQIDKLTKDIDTYRKLTPLDIWKNELSELSSKYQDYIK